MYNYKYNNTKINGVTHANATSNNVYIDLLMYI